MPEHDDDLESSVHEDTGGEMDAYPSTGDELDQDSDDRNGEDDDDQVDSDEDPAEL